MKLSRFRFYLPDELLVKFPLENREDSRMMVLNRKEKTIEHRKFIDIPEYFNDNDVMVINNTKVFPAKLYGNKEKTGAKIEVFLLRELDKDLRLWDVLVNPARKIRIGNKLYFGPNDMLVAEVVDNTTSRGRTIKFIYDGDYQELKRILEKMGETPIPKFLKRDPVPSDKERYQTIYAKIEGSVAAPTAGLHFSRNLLKRLELIGVKLCEITLHVGLGNFKSVDVEDLIKHKTESEKIIIPQETADAVNHAKENKYNVFAVGTTVIRTLESSVSTMHRLKPIDGWTNKFIFPPYDFSIPTRLLTNFHLPLSTMLMSVAAFGTFELVMNAYDIAVAEKYRFGPFGDAMLII